MTTTLSLTQIDALASTIAGIRPGKSRDKDKAIARFHRYAEQNGIDADAMLALPFEVARESIARHIAKLDEEADKADSKLATPAAAEPALPSKLVAAAKAFGQAVKRGVPAKEAVAALEDAVADEPKPAAKPRKAKAKPAADEAAPTEQPGFVMDPAAFKTGWKQKKGIMYQEHKGYLVETYRDGDAWAAKLSKDGQEWTGKGETFRKAIKDAGARV